jgi:hypothetical protein
MSTLLWAHSIRSASHSEQQATLLLGCWLSYVCQSSCERTLDKHTQTAYMICPTHRICMQRWHQTISTENTWPERGLKFMPTHRPDILRSDGACRQVTLLGLPPLVDVRSVTRQQANNSGAAVAAAAAPCRTSMIVQACSSRAASATTMHQCSLPHALQAMHKCI